MGLPCGLLTSRVEGLRFSYKPTSAAYFGGFGSWSSLTNAS
jgi:hypothetical protein